MPVVILIVAAACVAVNVPGMLQGHWYSWASGVFCLLLFFVNAAVILRR